MNKPEHRDVFRLWFDRKDPPGSRKDYFPLLWESAALDRNCINCFFEVVGVSIVSILSPLSAAALPPAFKVPGRELRPFQWPFAFASPQVFAHHENLEHWPSFEVKISLSS